MIVPCRCPCSENFQNPVCNGHSLPIPDDGPCSCMGLIGLQLYEIESIKKVLKPRMFLELDYPVPQIFVPGHVSRGTTTSGVPRK